MATYYPTRGSKAPYSTQKLGLLGGYSIASTSNTEVTSTESWEIAVDANTSIIRMRTDELAFMKYDGTPSATDYDYFIPQNATVDLYNIVGANTVNIIAQSANAHVLVTQY